MKHSFRIVAAASLAAVVSVGAAYAQGPAVGGVRGRGPGGPGGVMLPLGQLELTDAQRQQVRQMAGQHRDAMRPLVERMRTAADARRQAMAALPVDEGRIRAATEQLAQAQADLAVQQARLRSDIFALLTPEQQARAQQLGAERQAHRKRGQGTGVRIQ